MKVGSHVELLNVIARLLNFNFQIIIISLRWLKPGVLEQLLGRWTLRLIALEHPCDELFAFVADAFPDAGAHVGKLGADGSVQLLLGVPVVGHEAAEHGVEAAAGGPDVDLLGVWALQYELRRHVVRRAQYVLETVVLIKARGEPKVRQLALKRRPRARHQDVLQLDISMCDLLLMHIVQRVQNLSDKYLSIFLGYGPVLRLRLLDEVVEESAVGDQLGHNVIPLVVVQQFIYLHYARMHE